MAKLSAALILGLVGASFAVEGRAADSMATKPPPTATTSAPAVAPCTNVWDFITTSCQLTWQGVTIYGTVDMGGGWQSHGAPFDPRSPPGAAYYILKMNRSAMWGLAPNALSQSNIGIKGSEPIGSGFSFVFDWQAGFNPYSFQLANGPGSVYANAGVPLNQQTANADSSRAGQWYNSLGYVGVSSPTYGTLTVFRQNSLTLDGVIAYDPMGASYAFSPIGFSGITCGVGNTEDCRYSTSLKYRLNVGQFRVATLWQFGGYGQNNGSNGAYQFQAGADIPNLGNGVLSVDAIYSYVRDAVSISLGPGSNDAAGIPIPPFLPQRLTATISDNSSVMLLARYAIGPLKLYGGYERIRFTAPSDPQTAFTDIAGDFVCIGCATFNNTDISNTAFGVGGLGNKILQIMWTGARYAVTDNLDVMAGYYRYIQNSFFGTAAGGPAPCSDSSHSQCAGTFDAISAAIDWRFAQKWDLYVGLMFTQVSDGLANGYLQHNNIAPTAGLRFRF
jgi:predicted porin